MDRDRRADDAADHWMRLLEALECDCAGCDGTGWTLNAQWREWQQRATELVAVAHAARRAHELRPAQVPGGIDAEPAIVAVVERAIADHMRSRPAEPEETVCDACRGTGRQLTPAGHLFTDLLARHGFVRQW
ncbi:hypothetical protein E1287_24810 [Actinomadura sp. KC06]|uniref:hypothetical protein n=1 Tax=Actinomadura sp. KC06 TaxID=2530369 RepID=UPI00104AD07B|nr:hypothetical protein [Actinomadura sp. KC06]TDD31933.1 hypothetical protein E1287_24810 [Actinomadura sp. KC06]